MNREIDNLIVSNGFPFLNSNLYKNVVGVSLASATIVKSVAGVLHEVTINKPVINAILALYDNPSGASGTVIGTITYPATLLSDPPLVGLHDIRFTTGLTLSITGPMDVTISYR